MRKKLNWTGFGIATVAVALTLAMALHAPVAAQAPLASGKNEQVFSATMSASDAHAAANAGQLVLIDIRSPEEWKSSGVPASGYAITMHQSRASFFKQLTDAAGPQKDRRIAVICAVGNRSAYLRKLLASEGYANVIDVSEGMMGGPRGTGWIKSGLPTRPWNPNDNKPQKPKP